MTTKSRFASLDFFRALSIVWIMLYHYPRADGSRPFGIIGEMGIYAIDLFFVLSGFLISTQVFDMLKTNSRGFFLIFYVKRIFKTWPSYFAVVGLYFLFPILRELPNFPSLLQLLTFTQNFNMQYGTFSVSWSICVEEQFYLIFPVLAFFLVKKGPNLRFLLLLALLVVVGILSRYLIWNDYLIDSAGWDRVQTFLIYQSRIYYPTLNRMDGIIFGIALGYFNVYYLKQWDMVGKHHSRKILFLSIGFLSLGAALNQNKYSELSTVFRFLFTSVGFSFLCMFGLIKESFFQKFRLATIEYLSLISYSLYLTHRQAFKLAQSINTEFGFFENQISQILLSFTISFGFALIIYYGVETPFMKFRRQTILKIETKANGK